MAEININRDAKLIKVMAAQVRNERVDSDKAEEAASIIKELAQDMSPANRHQIAQLVAFTIDELQQHELDFLNNIADVKNVNLGDRPMFRVKTGGIKAYIQATGSTTARSYITDRQFTINTKEISARPAINIVDLRLNRINMADLIREANREITRMKLKEAETVLQAAISSGSYSSPFYATGTGIVQATLDGQINYFRRLGNVALLGDIAAVAQLAPLTGMATSASSIGFSGNMFDENNNNGFIGKYRGCGVISMTNAYQDGQTTPILDTDWIYILSSDVNIDQRNLKIVNEGPVYTMESQSIDDLTYEMRLDQRFGAAFCVGSIPTIGCYVIG